MNAIRLAPLALVSVAAVIDVRTRRIPNLLTFGGALCAFVFFLIVGGLPALGHSLAGWGVGLALFMPIFLLGGMGAGDVKLLAAVGAWLGPAVILWCAFYTVMAGGVLALIVGAMTGYLGKAFRNLWSIFGFWRAIGVKPVPGLTVVDAAGPRLPYGVAIAAGTALAVYLR
jgi:prepilin peptidase CpaA